MDLNPRSWGRVAQAALALLILIRIPAILAQPALPELAGAATGSVIGAYLLVGGVRLVALALPYTGVGGDASRQA